MSYKIKVKQEGFIALVSVLLISVILIIITFSISASGYFTRFNVLDSESKKISLGLAEGCVQKAMLNLAYGSLTVPQTVNIGTNSCKICSQTGGAPNTIKTRAVFNHSYSNVTVQLTKDAFNNFTINSWEDGPSYTGVGCNVP